MRREWIPGAVSLGMSQLCPTSLIHGSRTVFQMNEREIRDFVRCSSRAERASLLPTTRTNERGKRERRRTGFRRFKSRARALES